MTAQKKIDSQDVSQSRLVFRNQVGPQSTTIVRDNATLNGHSATVYGLLQTSSDRLQSWFCLKLVSFSLAFAKRHYAPSWYSYWKKKKVEFCFDILPQFCILRQVTTLLWKKHYSANTSWVFGSCNENLYSSRPPLRVNAWAIQWLCRHRGWAMSAFLFFYFFVSSKRRQCHPETWRSEWKALQQRKS